MKTEFEKEMAAKNDLIADLQLQITRLQNSEQEKKTYYFLFGETASRLYHDEAFEDYIKTVKDQQLEFAIHKFIEGEHPENIMEASSG